MKKIIHIEDDPTVCGLVRETIEDYFGPDAVAVETLEFEKAAENFIEDASRTENIVVIVVDLMVTYHWDYKAEISQEALRDGSFEAGFRLIAKIRASETWSDIPLIIFSSVKEAQILTRLQELGLTGIPVFQKTEDGYEQFMGAIQQATGLAKKVR